MQKNAQLSEVEDNQKEANKVIEKRLVQMWEDELDVEEIGINNDFFDLGGYSLKATSITMKVQKIKNKAIDSWIETFNG